jgi:hypothetical protein
LSNKLFVGKNGPESASWGIIFPPNRAFLCPKPGRFACHLNAFKIHQSNVTTTQKRICFYDHLTGAKDTGLREQSPFGAGF